MPYQIQDPAAGRPEIWVPVFMKVWAGSWLICSVCHRADDADVVGDFADCGRSVEISWPESPYRAKGCWGPKHLSCWFWSWAMGWPLVKDSGMGSPFMAASFGLWSNSSRWDGPPAW